MTKTFPNFPSLTADLAFDLIDRLNGMSSLRADFGASNQSCSRYVNVTVEGDDSDEEFKIRFSDHEDRYGSDITIRIDHLVEVVEDDCGEYVETRIEDWRYQEALDLAVAAVTKFVEAL